MYYIRVGEEDQSGESESGAPSPRIHSTMPQTIFRVGERVVTRDGFYAKIVHMEGMPAQHSDTFDQILVLDVASVGQREGMHASLVIPSRSRTVPTVGKYTGRILAANQRLHTCQRALQRLRHKKKNLGFSLLYDCLVVRKTNRAAIRKMLDRSARRTIFQAFHGYARAVGSIVAQRMKVGRAIERWKAHRQLAGAFDCYAGAVDTLVAQREKVAKVKEASMVEAKQSIQALEEDVGRKEAEIASLQAAWDKTKQKAGEYACHLNQGKAAPQFGTLSEMTIQFQSLKENVRRKEAEIASLQAAWDKAMQEAAVHASRLKDEVECVQENLIGMVCELKTLDEQASLDEKLLSKSQKIVEDLMSEKKSLLQSLSGKEESLKELKQNIAEAEAKRRIKACKRIVQRLLSHQLLMAWNMFVDTVRKMHHNRETMRKVLSLMQIRLLACAFDCYARAVNNVLAQRVKVAKTMAVWRPRA